MGWSITAEHSSISDITVYFQRNAARSRAHRSVLDRESRIFTLAVPPYFPCFKRICIVYNMRHAYLRNSRHSFSIIALSSTRHSHDRSAEVVQIPHPPVNPAFITCDPLSERTPKSRPVCAPPLPHIIVW